MAIATTPKARVTYSASWIDGVGRTFASADYGTNGGAAWTRPATVPTRSDTVLVNTTTWTSAGDVFSTLDPQSTETRFSYDAAGRQTSQIENYVSGGTAADQNRTTSTTYSPDGQVATLTASNVETGSQQTTYQYGTTLPSSAIASSQLLRKVIYPDSTGTNGDFVTYAYNRQGQQTLVIDQRGCEHTYDYDGLGRQTQDRVLSLGSSAVGSSRRISTSYDSRGMVATLTTWDDPRAGFGTVLNQVQNVYNDFGQQTHSYQEHGGLVNTSTAPKVEYSYANGSANTIRMTGMVYPSGRSLVQSYGSANGINDASSRVESIKFSAEGFNLVDYQYLGSSGFVNATSAQPGISWTLIGSGNDPNTGDIYWGLDRFGRVDNCLWKTSSATLAQIEYGYDRASNRTWRKDGVLSGYDELYSYDGLYRLTDQQRGTLNGTQTAITSGTFQQQWGLDATGNWKTFKQDNDGNGTWELNQTRTANKVNEITGITNSVGAAWATPSYDRAGNMVGIPNPPATTTGTTPAWEPFTESQWNSFTEAQWNAFTLDSGTVPTQLSARYDAWNRLVEIRNGATTLVENVYDARGYRIRKDTYVTGTLSEARHYYYTPGWQCVEERIGSTSTAERQFVWGLRYIDDLILRDRSTANNGTMNERRYGMQDGNWNMIAICDTTGAVTERFAYSAYGAPVFMTGAGTVQSASAIGFETLYAGYRWDGATPQMYNVRNRYLLPVTGTWNKRDPLGYVDGGNMLQLSLAINATDPLGLFGDTDFPVRIPLRIPVGGPGQHCAACHPRQPMSVPVDPIKSAIQSIPGNWPRCGLCTLGKAAKLLNNIKRVALTTRMTPGIMNPCERWTDAFILRRSEWLDSDCVISVNKQIAANIGITGRHVVAELLLCNGQRIWVDNTAFGGKDHVSTPSQRPATVLLLIPVWGYSEEDCDYWWFAKQDPESVFEECPRRMFPPNRPSDGELIRRALE